MRTETICLVLAIVIAACGSKKSTISAPEPTPEPAPVSTVVVASSTPGSTPTRVPIGVIEEDRAGLYGETMEPPSDYTPPEVIEIPDLEWSTEPGTTYRWSIVVYQFTVGLDGKAKEIECVRKSEVPAFNTACLNSIKEATFKPAMKGDDPIEVKYVLTCRPEPLY